jgi:hypothetical protein
LTILFQASLGSFVTVRSIFTAVLTFQGIDDLVMHVAWAANLRRIGLWMSKLNAMASTTVQTCHCDFSRVFSCFFLIYLYIYNIYIYVYLHLFIYLYLVVSIYLCLYIYIFISIYIHFFWRPQHATAGCSDSCFGRLPFWLETNCKSYDRLPGLHFQHSLSARGRVIQLLQEPLGFNQVYNYINYIFIFIY